MSLIHAQLLCNDRANSFCLQLHYDLRDLHSFPTRRSSDLYDVNTYVLERLTERARGVAEYIRPGGDIEHAVGALAAKISSPVLTDLALHADGVELYDLQPQGLPDLFADDELVVFGRYRGAGGGERSVTITGRRGGHEERFTTDASFGADAGARGYIQQLWADRKSVV